MNPPLRRAPDLLPASRLTPLLAPLLARCAGGGLILLLASTPAWAQFKVVGPDGRVTYTDRMPADAGAGAKVQVLRRDGTPAAVAGSAGNPTDATSTATSNAGNTSATAALTAGLPFELRSVVTRFPVTLYTSSDCAPCAQGRSLLTLRGVPYTERSVTSDDDIAALLRLTGGRTVPSLSVGGQALRGYQDADWHSTLDLAGYPRESRLPRGWAAAPTTPVVARSAATAAGGSSPLTLNGLPTEPSAPPPPPADAAASASFRF